MTKELSIVVPVYEQSLNIRPLPDELTQVLAASGLNYEILPP
jgi:hypothetical protein